MATRSVSFEVALATLARGASGASQGHYQPCQNTSDDEEAVYASTSHAMDNEHSCPSLALRASVSRQRTC